MPAEINILSDWKPAKVDRHHKVAIGKTESARKNMKEFKISRSKIQHLALSFASNPCSETFSPLEAEVRWSMRSKIMSIVKDDEATSEAYNIALLAIYRNISKYDPTKGSFHTWAVTIARHTAINYIEEHAAAERRNVAVPMSSLGDIDACGADGIIDIIYNGKSYDVYNTSKMLESVYDASMECIGYINPAVAEVLRARYVYGMKMNEIAESLNIPLHTVKNRILKGRALLLQEVKQRYPELHEMYRSPEPI